MNKLLALICVLFIGFTSCESEKKNVRKTTAKKEIQHYYCANKCEGSGGDVAGVCPTCSTPYTHNQAWHDKDMFLNGPLKVQSNAPQAPKTRAEEPARNALGVWHYTCPEGCSGGAGKAVACKSCGTTLAHNALYHQ